MSKTKKEELMDFNSTTKTIGDMHVEDPYLPFFAAVEQGIINEPEGMIGTLEQPPGVYIANGYIPNNRGAGIVAHGDGVAAFDFSTVVFEGKILEVTPCSKTAVEHDTGRITQAGGVVLELGDGRIRLAGLAIDVTADPWRARELLNDRYQFISHAIAVLALSSLDVPEYEITDIQAETGVLKARERRRIYGF